MVAFRLSSKDLADIDEVADIEGISRSEAIRLLVKFALDWLPFDWSIKDRPR